LKLPTPKDIATRIATEIKISRYYTNGHVRLKIKVSRDNVALAGGRIVAKNSLMQHVTEELKTQNVDFVELAQSGDTIFITPDDASVEYAEIVSQNVSAQRQKVTMKWYNR